jgi:hypothetical protein
LFISVEEQVVPPPKITAVGAVTTVLSRTTAFVAAAANPKFARNRTFAVE